MKVAIASDIHLHAFSAYATVRDDGINSRLAAGISAVTTMTSMARERGAEHVLLSGDILHVGARQLTSAMSPVAAMFRTLSETRMKFDIAAGNHDMASLDGSMHALEFLKGYPGFRVHDHPAGIRIGQAQVDLVPFYRGQGELAQQLDARRPTGSKSGPRILVAHTGIAAAQMAGESVIDHGAIDPTHFEGWDLAIAGHYHGHQTGQFNGGEWLIPGSLVQVDASEEGHSKGFVLLDTDTMDWEFVEVESPQFMTLRLPTDLPRLDELKANPKRYLRLVGETPEFKEADAARLMEGAEALWAFEPCTVSADGPRLAITLDTSPTAMVDRFVEHKSPEGYDLKRLAETGKRFLE